MSRVTALQIIKTVIMVCFGSYLRVAASATAVATITVNIVNPAPGNDGLSLSSMAMTLDRKRHGEITIINNGSYQREVFVELESQSGAAMACKFRYSPKYSTIPPGGRQVVRLMREKREGSNCTVDHQLLIGDVDTSGVPVFSVPIIGG